MPTFLHFLVFMIKTVCVLLIDSGFDDKVGVRPATMAQNEEIAKICCDRLNDGMSIADAKHLAHSMKQLLKLQAAS